MEHRLLKRSNFNEKDEEKIKLRSKSFSENNITVTSHKNTSTNMVNLRTQSALRQSYYSPTSAPLL